jgi:hypothetical protein
MIMQLRGALVAAAAARALALAGCGADTAPTTPTTPTGAVSPTVEPQAQTVAWTDSVCSALVPISESLMNPPGLDPTALAATRDAYVSYLTRAQGAADTALQDVTAAGSAPVDDGQQVADEVQKQLTDLRDDLADARTQLEQADINNATAIGRAVVAAGNVVGAVGNNAQALSAIDGNPRLDAAFEQAQSCQRLRAIRTPGNRTR